MGHLNLIKNKQELKILNFSLEKKSVSIRLQVDLITKKLILDKVLSLIFLVQENILLARKNKDLSQVKFSEVKLNK
jgi:hypothetical protein